MSDFLGAQASIAAFLTALAAKTPTPGGGATAALAGAIGCAQANMVVRFSLTKASAEARPMLEKLDHTLETGRSVFLNLMIEDQQAYAAYREARSLPDSDSKKASLADASAKCLLIPQSMLALAASEITAIEPAVSSLNRFLLSDLIVAAELLCASARSAAAIVETNLDTSPEHAGIRRSTSNRVELVESTRGRINQTVALIRSNQG